LAVFAVAMAESRPDDAVEDFARARRYRLIIAFVYFPTPLRVLAAYSILAGVSIQRRGA
jgi:hypothetical protein